MCSTMDCINYLGWELRGEFEIALTDGDKLNFYRYFLRVNVKKKIICAKVTFNLTVNMKY